MRAAFPAVVSFKGIRLRVIVHHKITHTHTETHLYYMMYASVSVALSLLSRMHSSALPVFFTVLWCTVGLRPRKGIRWDTSVILSEAHCLVGSQTAVPPLHLHAITYLTCMHYKGYEEHCYDTILLRSIQMLAKWGLRFGTSWIGVGNGGRRLVLPVSWKYLPFCLVLHLQQLDWLLRLRT